MNYIVASIWMVSMLLNSGVFSVEDGVDFEPVPVWEPGADGKNHPTSRQAVGADGKPLWRLPLRAKVLRFGRVARVDASVTLASMATPHVADIPDAVQEDVLELGSNSGKEA